MLDMMRIIAEYNITDFFKVVFLVTGFQSFFSLFYNILWSIDFLLKHFDSLKDFPLVRHLSGFVVISKHDCHQQIDHNNDNADDEDKVV
jgi:hypothetical protein